MKTKINPQTLKSVAAVVTLAALSVFAATAAGPKRTLPTGPVSISGTVDYCTDPTLPPVRGVTLTLTGSQSGMTLSEGSGNYSFTSLASGGNYTVTPTKAALTPGSPGINTVDLIATQRHFLGVTPLTGCNLTAGDVAAPFNNDPNTADVLAIQKFFLVLGGAGNSGNHKFTPASRSYTGLVTNQTAQNYDTLIFGDVVLSSAPTTGAESVSLPTATLDPSVPIATVITQPVVTTAISSGLNYIGFQADFTFDSAVVSFATPQVQAAGLTATNWNVSSTILNTGPGTLKTLRVSAFSTDTVTPLSGAGTLFNLRMLRVSSTPADTSQLVWAANPNNFIFIDGNLNSIAATQFNGQISIAGSRITNAGFDVLSAGPNYNLDPGETVTVSFYAQNSGGSGVVCTTAALTGTLQASGGVTSPSAAQNYGALCSESPAVHREFTFTVDPALPCGSTVTASLVMTDGATNYGTLTYTFITGSLNYSFFENFDDVVAPALPGGWTTTFSGTGTAVTTSTTLPDTVPNDIFLSEGTNVGLSEVMSPTIALPAGPASKLTFRNLFNTEASFDGLVLEISINGGAFQDILAAGGTFASGGYNSTLSTGSSNPLPGRMAWSGLSGGTEAAPAYITTVVNLPAAASGQNIQLKWRMGADNGTAPATNPGSRIDTISISTPVCGGTSPTVDSVVSRMTHGAAGDFDIDFPQESAMIPDVQNVESRRGSPPPPPLDGYFYDVYVTFTTPVRVGYVEVTSGRATLIYFQVFGGCCLAPDYRTYKVRLFVNFLQFSGERLAIHFGNVQKFGGGAGGSRRARVAILIGDVNVSTSVTSSDVVLTKGQVGQVLTNANFRADVNVSGVVTAGDIAVVKSRVGTALRP